MAEIYPDSKTFVDMKLKESSETILAAFEQLGETSSDKSVIEDFVNTYFEGPNLEFDNFEPTDWKEEPLFLEKIEDESYKKWAKELHKLWFTLGRKIKTDVQKNTDEYSLIYVDNHFIVPGGRFREFFYWDTYWIIKGMLLSEMYDTVKGMLRNWVTLIDTYGKILNGNRVYFEDRSQPPYFILTVMEYYKATQDRAFLAEMLPKMEAEYQFWMTERTVNIYSDNTKMNHTLNIYDVAVGKPRPESYREDRVTTEGLNADEAAIVHTNIASACESGWDFSSRWLGADNTLESIRTTKVIPADLNSILCLSERIMAVFYIIIGNMDKSNAYSLAFKERREAVKQILWNNDVGVWLDYDLETGTTKNNFAVSNIAPLWARCFDEDESGGVSIYEAKSLEYLQNLKVLEFPGGVPATLSDSGQQWDYPNVWPPLQEILIQAISSINSDEAQQVAFNLASNWTNSNWEAYDETNVMYEKYNCNNGAPGSGGEYFVQDGFGWTNGVILTLLDKYGDRLINPSSVAVVTSMYPLLVIFMCSCSVLFGRYI